MPGIATHFKVLELGYTNNPAAIPHLVELTAHNDSMVRATAISGLGILRATGEYPLLKRSYEEGRDTVKFMALKSIGDLDTQESREFIASVAQSSDYTGNAMIREIVDLYR